MMLSFIRNSSLNSLDPHAPSLNSPLQAAQSMHVLHRKFGLSSKTNRSSFINFPRLLPSGLWSFSCADVLSFLEKLSTTYWLDAVIWLLHVCTGSLLQELRCGGVTECARSTTSGCSSVSSLKNLSVSMDSDVYNSGKATVSPIWEVLVKLIEPKQ